MDANRHSCHFKKGGNLSSIHIGAGFRISHWLISQTKENKGLITTPAPLSTFMLKNLCKPYKEFQLSNITQDWSERHKAFDLARWDKKSYGTILVAMENCVVENIMTVENWDNGWEMDRGYGVLLRSIANPEVKYSYWHCLPFFPVKKGDTVLQGQPVAQMGNSGFCLSNGVVVLLADRLKPPYKGTHLHMSCPKDTIDRIDYTIPIKIDILTMVSITLKNIMEFIKSR